MSLTPWYPATWHFGFDLDDDDRPVKLAGPDEPGALTYHYCAEAEAAAIKGGQIVRGKVIRERCSTPDLADELEIVTANRRAIRNCWRTPAYVWETVARVAGLEFGRSLITDPFDHPDSAIARFATTRLDGHDGRNGFDTSLWQGFALVNGPHSDSAEVARVTREYGEACLASGDPTTGAALFAPYRGDRWLTRDAATAPIWLHFGRVACAAPVSVKKSGPTGATIVAIWAHPDASTWTRKLYTQGHYRLAVAPTERSKVEILVTRGVPATTYEL